MNVTAHHLTDLDELDRRIRKETHALQRDRYRVIRLSLEGRTKAEIQARTGRSGGSVELAAGTPVGVVVVVPRRVDDLQRRTLAVGAAGPIAGVIVDEVRHRSQAATG